MQTSDFTIEKLENGNYVVKTTGIYQDIDFVNGGYITTEQRAEEIRDLIVQQNTPSIDNIKKNKLMEVEQSYEKEIYNTFTSTAFDGKTEETYSCSQTDQVRINGEVTMAMAVKAGFSTESISWKNVNQVQCVAWTADSMIKLGTDLHAFVTAKTDYLEALTVYINSLTTIDDVNKVTWGMTIPTTTT